MIISDEESDVTVVRKKLISSPFLRAFAFYSGCPFSMCYAWHAKRSSSPQESRAFEVDLSALFSVIKKLLTWISRKCRVYAVYSTLKCGFVTIKEKRAIKHPGKRFWHLLPESKITGKNMIAWREKSVLYWQYGKSENIKGGLPSTSEGLTLQTKEERRVMPVYVTYQDLIQIGIFIVALVGLCYTIFKGRK